MSRKPLSYFSKVFIYCLILFSLLVSLISILVFHSAKNKEVHHFQQISTIKPSNKNNKVFVQFKKSNYLINEDSEYTFIYEGTIENSKRKTFSDWEIKTKLPESSRINGFWNCEIEIENGILCIKPNSNVNNIIHSGQDTTFGFFIESNNNLSFRALTLSGYLQQKIFDNEVFCFLLFSFIIILVLFISFVVHKSKEIKKIQAIQLQKEHDDILIEQTMLTFVNFIDNKDPYTRGHSNRVANYSKEIARRMGMSEQDQLNIYYAGLMHDIGKITISDEILNKQTKLSSDEWEKIQMHTANGASLLKNFTILPMINDAVLYHHERYDGTGYINRLSGEKIPLVARIVCIADSYDAMASNRCYRLKFSEERIILELERCASKQFDPKIIPFFIDIIKDGTIYKI